MITEHSCGAVVFTREHGCPLYVIVRSKEGVCGFPKGHMEGNESECQTALREVGEETGLSVALIDGFRAEDAYTFTRGGETRCKRVVYFLAEYARQLPTVQESELSGIHLLSYEDALAALTFERARRILTQAHSFLTQL